MKVEKLIGTLVGCVAILVAGKLVLNHLSEYVQQQQAEIASAAQTSTTDTCVSDDCLTIIDLDYPVGELPTEVENALAAALDDEYKAYATYEAVIEQYGSVRPFIMIIRAEEQHISSLKALYDKYGLAVPANNWQGQVTVPNSLAASCQAGVDAEIANAALYREQLLPAVSQYPDITQVFTNLMNASQQKHLRAFERCN